MHSHARDSLPKERAKTLPPTVKVKIVRNCQCPANITKKNISNQNVSSCRCHGPTQGIHMSSHPFPSSIIFRLEFYTCDAYESLYIWFCTVIEQLCSFYWTFVM